MESCPTHPWSLPQLQVASRNRNELQQTHRFTHFEDNRKIVESSSQSHNGSVGCPILTHHINAPSCTINAPFMLSSTALECDQKAQQNWKMSLDGSTAATSKTAGQMRTPSWHGIQNCRPMNVPKNLDSDHYTTAKKRRSRKSNPGPATWGLTSSRICMSRQTRAQATASAWLKQVCFSGPSLNRCHFRQQLPLWDPSEHPSHPKSLSEHGKSPPGNCQGLECHLVTLSGSFTSNGSAGKLIEARDFSKFLYQRRPSKTYELDSTTTGPPTWTPKNTLKNVCIWQTDAKSDIPEVRSLVPLCYTS